MIKIKNFKIYIDNSYQTVCRAAAMRIVSHVKTTPSTVIGFATGNSPKQLYKYIIEYSKLMNVSFQQVRTFNLDEYVDIPQDSTDSYRTYMNEHLFNHLDFSSELIHFPETNRSIDQAILEYQSLLNLYPIDIQVLGIGHNGHIGFNEPGTIFESKTHLSKLTPSTLNANRIHFADKMIPTHAITMGIQEIMQAKEIILVANGKSKKKPIHQMVHGALTIDFPASILQLHPNICLYLDAEAAELIT